MNKPEEHALQHVVDASIWEAVTRLVSVVVLGVVVLRAI